MHSAGQGVSAFVALSVSEISETLDGDDDFALQHIRRGEWRRRAVTSQGAISQFVLIRSLHMKFQSKCAAQNQKMNEVIVAFLAAHRSEP
jgi:hypothetical protein